jgi:hypothetical protein
MIFVSLTTTKLHEEVGKWEEMEVIECVNLMEAINHAQQNTITFFIDCHAIVIIVCNLWPIMI